jgi:hypothetical protein
VVFPMIKRPPQFAPEVMYVDMVWDLQDTAQTINFNNLRRKMFQFKYKYTYLDNQESAYSPISRVPLPPYEVDIEGEWDDNICKNNAIGMKLNTGNSYVKKITIAARECQNRSALGDFYIIKEVDKYDKNGTKLLNDFETYPYFFLNTKQLENINTPINNRYCDDVPLSGNDTTLLDGKYCAISLPKKNYDLVDIDYSLEPIPIEITGSELVQTIIPYSYNDSNHNYTVTITYYANSEFYIEFDDHSHVHHSYHIDSGMVAPPTSTQLAHDLANAIEIDKANVAHLNSCTHINNVITLDFNHNQPTWGTFNAYYLEGGSEEQLVTPSLKHCQYHPFVIIYNDGFGRYGIAQGDKELYSPVEQDCNSPWKICCRMSINNKPPDWAFSYRIGYLPNKSYLYFLQVPYVQSWVNGTGKIFKPQQTATIKVKDIPTGYYFLLINQSIRRMRENYPNVFIADYIFTEGDRVRKVCSGDTYEILRELTINYWLDSHAYTVDPDGTITGYLIKQNLIDSVDFINLLEVYRPSVSISIPNGSYNNIFYETGDEYVIENPGQENRRHMGQEGVNKYGYFDINQVLDINNNPVSPAILYLEMADVYIRNRMGVKPNLTYSSQSVEDINYSDFFTSNGISMGRVTAKIESKQKTLNSVVRGEQFLEGTETNWLNVFLLGTKSFDASDLYGKITGIDEMGGTLKVLQEHKETSITIGEVTAKFADVGEFTYIGDTVFGAYRRYPENRGTTYRRSMAQNNRYLYYFDESTGEFIRSSPNGQAPVSKEYSMQNWFEKKAKSLREFVGYKDVVTSFDNDYEEVLVSFIIGDTIETKVFSEKEGNKGWLESVKYFNDTDIPELFASFKDTLVSWMNGQLYLHNSGANNTFYGKLHGCSLKAVVNGHLTYTKRYSSIRLSTDKNLWNIEFTIPQGENYPDQKTILRTAMMRKKENALYSDILRNIISRAGVEDFTLIYDGTRMVGEYMDVEISDATSDDVSLGAVQVNYLIAK